MLFNSQNEQERIRSIIDIFETLADRWEVNGIGFRFSCTCLRFRKVVEAEGQDSLPPSQHYICSNGRSGE